MGSIMPVTGTLTTNKATAPSVIWDEFPAVTEPRWRSKIGRKRLSFSIVESGGDRRL